MKNFILKINRALAAKKQKIILISLLFVAVAAMAETSLIIKPLSGEERANALSQIGYVKVTPDSLFVYSHGDVLLGKEAIKNIRHIRYGEPNKQEGIDDVNVTTCRIYPNPTQDMLVIDNAGCDKAFIFDLNGHLLQSVAIDGDHATINVTSLSQGDYILLLNTQTFKFIKQ